MDKKESKVIKTNGRVAIRVKIESTKKTPQTPKMSNKSNCEEKWDRNRAKRKNEKRQRGGEEEEVLIKRRVEEGKSTINNWGPFYRLLRVYLFFFCRDPQQCFYFFTFFFYFAFNWLNEIEARFEILFKLQFEFLTFIIKRFRSFFISLSLFAATFFFSN